MLADFASAMSAAGGTMDERVSSGRGHRRIPNAKRRDCLSLFEKGFGYKKAAKISGLNAYTVRDYLRRYKAGDLSWAARGRDGSDES